ncbi:MAG: APC family permease [Candidatus Hydrogenedentota bacterium]|nr:MAG: APC family permease [Candidatus Hydrogenedentota bacterium]
MNAGHTKVSLWIAALININAIVGGAFFIIAPKISAITGGYAPLAWVGCALILFPVAVVFSRFAKKFPYAGGIYIYSKKALGKLAGFTAGWTYFVGGATGNAVLIDAFAEQILTIPYVANIFYTIGINKLGLSLVCTALCAILALHGIEIMEAAQIAISWVKIVPFVILAIGCIFLTKLNHLTTIVPQNNWFSDSLPLIIFSYIGIETCNSIAHKIKNGAENVSKATYISLFTTAVIYSVAHLGLILSMGTGGAKQGAFTRLAWIIGNKIGPSVATILSNLVLFSVAISYLGGAYSVFCSNNWILHSMSSGLKGPSKEWLAILNSKSEPTICIILQGIIMMTALVLGSKNPTWMIQASTVCVIFSFAVTVISYLKIFSIPYVLSGLSATLSVALMVFFATKELVESGFTAAITTASIAVAGVIVYLADRANSN